MKKFKLFIRGIKVCLPTGIKLLLLDFINMDLNISLFSNKILPQIYQRMIETFQVLPYRIGKELLQIQFEIGSGVIAQHIIEKAVSLYTEAIQHNINCLQTSQSQTQQQNHSKAYKFYQQKLRKLLAQKEVSECLEPNKKPVQSRKRVNSQISKKNMKQKIEKAQLTCEQNSKYITKQFIESQLFKKKLIRREMQQQNQDIQRRLQRRVKMKSQSVGGRGGQDQEI